MVKMSWILLVVFSVKGDGSGHILSERFGPYASQGACAEAAAAVDTPISDSLRRVGIATYCIPEN